MNRLLPHRHDSWAAEHGTTGNGRAITVLYNACAAMPRVSGATNATCHVFFVPHLAAVVAYRRTVPNSQIVFVDLMRYNDSEQTKHGHIQFHNSIAMCFQATNDRIS